MRGRVSEFLYEDGGPLVPRVVDFRSSTVLVRNILSGSGLFDLDKLNVARRSDVDVGVGVTERRGGVWSFDKALPEVDLRDPGVGVLLLRSVGLLGGDLLPLGNDKLAFELRKLPLAESRDPDVYVLFNSLLLDCVILISGLLLVRLLSVLNRDNGFVPLSGAGDLLRALSRFGVACRGSMYPSPSTSKYSTTLFLWLLFWVIASDLRPGDFGDRLPDGVGT